MLQLVSLLTFFLADIVKLGEKLEIGKCLPRGSKDIYADIARFKGLIKGRKSWDDDPCNFSPILAIRDEFSLREDAFQNDCNTNMLVHFDLKSLSISKKKRNLNWKSIERVRERKIGRGGSSIE